MTKKKIDMGSDNTAPPIMASPDDQNSAKVNAAITTNIAGSEDDVSSKGETDAASVDEVYIPLKMKLLAVLMVSVIGFGSRWSSGVTAAMKSTLKKELSINNTQYAMLEGSQDFMKMTLILFVGVLTDRLGGAGAMVGGNVIYTIGSIVTASATNIKSYRTMVGGMVIEALGDIATQVAQYKIFSSWFAPSNGFAFTLAFELAIGRLGAFVGAATANPIAKGTGQFYWVYWTAVFMNLFTNGLTVIFWFFRRYCDRKYPGGIKDPSTGERLHENTKKFDIPKIFRLPWAFWGFIVFSAFQTAMATVFVTNATELAEQRFKVDGTKAGWYVAATRYMGFFLVPMIGAFIDALGNRLTLLNICGVGCLIAMCLVCFDQTARGTAASFGVFAVAFTFGPTPIIDGIRTSIWHHDTFGVAYAVKICVNNAMNVIIRVITGVIQDRDDDSYRNVVIVYVVLAAGAVVVAAVLLACSTKSRSLKRLQWTRKQRLRDGEQIEILRKEYETGAMAVLNRRISISLFGALLVLLMGAWAAYFWGLATGKSL